MFSLFSSKNKPHLSLILDVQSALVRATLVQVVNKTQKPHIIWTQQIDTPYRTDNGTAALVDATIDSITKLASDSVRFTSQQEYLKKFEIKTIHCVMSSPWIVSEARTVSETFPKQTTIKRAYVKSVVEKARIEMLKGHAESMKSIEEKIFDVRLNGYSIERWDGNKSDDIEISFALSMMNTGIIDKIERAIKTVYTSARVDFHSSLLLQHIALKSCVPIRAPHMVVHTHGELTDIVVASDQSCILFASFPIGIRTITRNLVSSGFSEAEADSALALYESDQVDMVHGSREVEGVENALKDWVANVENIYKAAPVSYRPDRATISARTHENLFVKKIKNTLGFPVVDVLPHEDLFTLVSFDPAVERMRLTILYVVAIHTLEYI